MNVYPKLKALASVDTPLRVGLIGAGKFGSMYLSQVRRTPGVRLTAVADSVPGRAEAALKWVGWGSECSSVGIVGDGLALIERGDVDIVIEATGSPSAGVRHALACSAAGKHVVMANVEADALAGPWLAAQARAAGVVYSLAYGDQPAMICELVDWARTCGFEVMAAGKGTKYLPTYHASTPETVWAHYGISAQEAQSGGLNAQMFNSFLDGTKSAIEMCAVANATGLAVPEGLTFPPCGVDDLPQVLCPQEDGGVLTHRGQTEVVSSLRRDGTEVARDLRWGVFVTFAAGSDYVTRCFKEYGLVTDVSGRYAALYKPFHMIGLELGVSVASVGLHSTPTGEPMHFQADVAAVAKRNLSAGQTLDGEGGFTVYGRLMPARSAMSACALPIGLTQNVRLVRDVGAGQLVRWDDVEMDERSPVVRARRASEQMLP